MMEYLGKDDGDSHVIMITSSKLMNRLYKWNHIKLGTMDGFNRVWPWDPAFRMHRWIEPEFKEWLELHATSEDGMPLYSIRWRDVEIQNSFRKHLHIHFYRERATALFRLTFS